MRVMSQSPDPLARMHTKTKRQGKSGAIDAPSEGGRGVSAGAGADGAAGGARSGDDRGARRREGRTGGGPAGVVGLLRPDIDHAGWQAGIAGTAGPGRTVLDRVVRTVSALGAGIGGGAGG